MNGARSGGRFIESQRIGARTCKITSNVLHQDYTSTCTRVHPQCTQCMYGSTHCERGGVLEVGGIQLSGQNYATKPFRRALIKANHEVISVIFVFITLIIFAKHNCELVFAFITFIIFANYNCELTVDLCI